MTPIDASDSAGAVFFTAEAQRTQRKILFKIFLAQPLRSLRLR
jgi:hypothetical protein